MIKVVFRVDSSIKIGSGHLMRCLTLADELQKSGQHITFICRELDGSLIDLIRQKNQQVIILPADSKFQSDKLYLNWLGATQQQDAQQTIKVIDKNTDLLVVDSYALDETWHQQLRPYTKKIMVIDDLAGRQFNCDILLNQNLGSKKQDYTNKVPNGCELLLGCDYALLREEFAQLRGQALEKRQNTKTIKNILISMGGSDLKNITHEALQQLDDSFSITVVLGGPSTHNKMIKNYAKGKNIKVIIGAENMATLMLNADLAIGAGGSTSWERCCLGLPTLLYITAENQTKITKNLENLGAVKIVQNLTKDFRVMIDNFNLWQEMSKQAQNVCDGLGINRVIKCLQ